MLENTFKHVKLMIEYIFVQIKVVSISYEPSNEPREAETLRIDDEKIYETIVMHEGCFTQLMRTHDN